MMNYVPPVAVPLENLKEKDTCDLIATSPWVCGDCEMPHRIVLRDLINEFVIHIQVVGTDSAFFTSGHYFPYHPERRADAFRDAWKTFLFRSNSHLGVEP